MVVPCDELTQTASIPGFELNQIDSRLTRCPMVVHVCVWRLKKFNVFMCSIFRMYMLCIYIYMYINNIIYRYKHFFGNPSPSHNSAWGWPICKARGMSLPVVGQRWLHITYHAGQIITTSAEVTLNCGLVRASLQRPSGLGISYSNLARYHKTQFANWHGNRQ